MMKGRKHDPSPLAIRPPSPKTDVTRKSIELKNVRVNSTAASLRAARKSPSNMFEVGGATILPSTSSSGANDSR